VEASWINANSLCVEIFHAEVGYSGILFNDPYGIPVVTLEERANPEVTGLIDVVRREQDESEQHAVAQYPMADVVRSLLLIVSGIVGFMLTDS
jgi:hypothetical protein